jgi:Kef-type K+ transport system membrane component KefB
VISLISRGEVGLVIVAGVGISSGALTYDIYTAIIITVAATTIIIITQFGSRCHYKKRPPEPPQMSSSEV